MKRSLTTIALLTALTCTHDLFAQTGSPDDTGAARPATVVRAPGPRYAAGWLHRLFFGDHWRDAWTTETEVEVLDLARFAGGLTPIKRGGGFQTRSLRFQGADGRKYKFRSLDKDPSKVLPKELQESIAADVVQDQISTSNPYAPFVVAPLLDAVGVLNAEPRLVLLPDDPRLGEFRGEFANMLGILEEHPDARDDGEPGFAGSDKVESTLDLFARLEKRNDEWPDARAYLTARLMDILLGDWDRHVDQWQWARVVENDRALWKPVPRDRDQAFARYDGILPWVASNAVAQLEGFSETYPKIADLTWSGRHVDRRFLVSLDRGVWDSTAAFIVATLDDGLIEAAVRRLPPSLHAAEGASLASDLRARRDALPEAALEFYRELAKAVDVRASKRDELATVERLDDTLVRVAIVDRETRRAVFERTFDAHETRELRLHLGDGADSIVIEGVVSSSIPVRIVGGDGADVLVDRSRVDGFALGLIPFIPDAETATIFYDDGRKTVVEEGASTSVVGGTIAEPATLEERFEPQVPDFGHDWRYGPWLGYDSDLGLFVGGGPILYEFGFRTEPYVYRMSLLAGYATLAQTFRAQFDGDFRDVVGRSRLIVRARASGLEVQNYFGRGNESERDQRLVDADHYEVRQRQYTASVELGIPLFEGAEITSGIGGGYYRTDDPDEARFVTVERPYGVEPTTLLHGTAGLHIDTRDVASNPSSGLYVDVRGELTPPVLDAVSAFASVQADVRGYIGADWPVQTTLALRAAGEKVMGGEIPFFALAMLGGAGSLRGFDSERFAGESSLAGGAELRVGILRFKVLVPGIIGVTAAVESGRVFHSAEHSTRWHTSYGGGLYLMLVERAITVSATAMRSEEALGVYLTGGFGW